MLLLDRYIIRLFCKYFALVLGALVAMYFLIDFFERVDDFFKHGLGLALAGRYFFLKIPTMVDNIYPITVLLAGVITLGILEHNREFMSLKACGISVSRVCLPIVGAAIISSLAALFLAQWILPKTLTETNHIWHEQVHHQVPKGTIRKGRVYHKGRRGIYSFRRPDIHKNVFSDFSYTELSQNFSLIRHISAQKAVWHQGIWTFTNGVLEHPEEAGAENSLRPFKEINLELPEGPSDFFVPKYRVKERSISDLFQEVRKSGGAQKARFDLHNRLSFILIGLPLILIGLPTLLIITQRWGHGLTLALPVSCGIALAMWGGWSTAQSMAKAYDLNPVLPSWGLHLLVGALGIWLIRRQDAR